jgi:uncharacterized membrane protein (Fun14 family)
MKSAVITLLLSVGVLVLMFSVLRETEVVPVDEEPYTQIIQIQQTQEITRTQKLSTQPPQTCDIPDTTTIIITFEFQFGYHTDNTCRNPMPLTPDGCQHIPQSEQDRCKLCAAGYQQ